MQASTAQKQQIAVEELALQLAGLVKHLMTATGADFFQAVEDLGLSLSQLKSLQLLSEEEQALSVKALSDRLGLSLPAVSRAVDGLVRRGLVTREEDPRDRRSKLLLVTPDGRRTVEELLALRVAGLRQFVDALEPDERAALAAGLVPLLTRPEIRVQVPRR